MAQRASLPTAAATITPGYSWRLDLDVQFDGERPADWTLWTIRMHIWSDSVRFTLTNGDGVSFEPVEDLPGATGPIVIPVIIMSEARTESLRGLRMIQYVIDLKAPAGDAEDYFAGPLVAVHSPPAEMLA